MQGTLLQTVNLANIVNLRQTQVWWAQQAKASMHSTEMHKDEKDLTKKSTRTIEVTMESNMYIDNCTISHSYSLLLGNYQQTIACRYSSEDAMKVY